MKKSLSFILSILFILTALTGGALSESLPQTTLEDFVGNWILAGIDNGGGTISANSLGLDGTLLVEVDRVTLSIGDKSEQHPIQFGNNSLQITDTSGIPAIILNEDGELTYSLPDNDNVIYLLFKRETVSVSSPFAQIIKDALKTNDEDLKESTATPTPAAEPTASTESTNQKVIFNRNAEVKDNPSSISGKTIGTIVANQRYILLSVKDNWYNIQYEKGKEGWVWSIQAEIINIPQNTVEEENIPIQVTINEQVRSGSYTGELINGIPNGHGTFVSQDGFAAVKYEGEWKDGKFNPTWAEMLQLFGRADSFRVNQKSIDFLNSHKNMFSSKVSITSSYCNKNWNLSSFKKNPSLYCDKLILVEDLSVVQIFALEQFGRKYELSIMEDKDGTLYYGYFDGSTNITDNMFIENIYLLPLDWSTYKNTEGTELWAVFCAYTKIINSSTSTGKVRINNGSYPNVRSGPSTDSPKIGSAQSNQVYELLAVSGNWYKIRLENGQVGWIAGGMAQIIERH